MVVDLVLQIERVQTFFLRKYLFLSQFSNLKTPTEDSRLRHRRDFVHLFFTKEEFACLFKKAFKKQAKSGKIRKNILSLGNCQKKFFMRQGDPTASEKCTILFQVLISKSSINIKKS
jgi:hypothetical protein